MEVWKAAKPFVTGSMSGCMATTCIQPVDMIKVRVQLGAAEGGVTNPFTVAGNLIKQDGVMGLYKGLDAGLTRQVFYTGARLGLYDQFTAAAAVPGEKMPFWKTTVCALSAGGIAAVVGNPADLSLIRMLGFNSLAKDQLSDMGVKGPALTFGASAIAGFFASFFSLPFDYVKTQVQKMKPDPVTGELPFKGPIDSAMQQVKQGGITRLWTGFPTYYVRIAPHAMITLIAQDAVKKFWGSMGM